MFGEKPQGWEAQTEWAKQVVRNLGWEVHQNEKGLFPDVIQTRKLTSDEMIASHDALQILNISFGSTGLDKRQGVSNWAGMLALKKLGVILPPESEAHARDVVRDLGWEATNDARYPSYAMQTRALGVQIFDTFCAMDIVGIRYFPLEGGKIGIEDAESVRKLANEVGVTLPSAVQAALPDKRPDNTTNVRNTLSSPDVPDFTDL